MPRLNVLGGAELADPDTADAAIGDEQIVKLRIQPDLDPATGDLFGERADQRGS